MNVNFKKYNCFIAIIIFSLSKISYAHEWGMRADIKVVTPSSAPGLVLGTMEVRVDHPETRDLSNQRIKYSLNTTDHLGNTIGKWTFDVEGSDEQCLRSGADKCLLTKTILPIAAFHYACRGNLKLIQGSSELGHGSSFVMPHCGREFSNNSNLDLLAPKILDQEGVSVSLEVKGSTSATKPFPVSAIILDSKGNILWAARKIVESPILPGVPVELNFDQMISNKVKKLGCNIHLSVNDRGALIEKDLSNNDSSYEWGDCLMVNEDNIDIEPLLSYSNGLVIFGAKNIGEIDVEMPSVLYKTYTAQGRVLENLQFRLRGNSILESFGEVSILERNLNSGTCLVEVVVDPNWIIQNENRTNNYKSINLCSQESL